MTAEDVRIAQRDVAGLRAPYIRSVEQLADTIVKRNIDEGTLVTIDLLNAEKLIKRGQSVTLSIARGGLNVRMSGTALSDGAVNQRIRVQNHSSKRIVEGIVRSRQLVEVIL